LSLEPDVHNDGAGSNVLADVDARIRRRPSRTAAAGPGCTRGQG